MDFNWCEKHWALVRSGREQGNMNGLVAKMELVVQLLSHERFRAKVGPNPTAERTNEAMVECSPICCFVGEAAMAKVYAEARLEPPRKEKP